MYGGSTKANKEKVGRLNSRQKDQSTTSVAKGRIAQVVTA
jgi:hypothetical protein